MACRGCFRSTRAILAALPSVVAAASRLAPSAARAPSATRGFAAAAVAGPSSFVTLDESTQSLSDIVAKSPRVVAYFTASWCGPCRAIAPYWAEVSAKHAGSITFVKIDVDENGATAEEAGIRSVPTFKSFANGKETGSFAGASKGNLDGMVAGLASAAAGAAGAPK